MLHERGKQWMLIKNIILLVIGLAGGFTIAGGVFAFITMIGIIPRLASRTGTAKYMLLFENAIIAGGILGNLIYIFEWHVPISIVGIIVFGFFTGIFTGCLAMALAEVLNVIPIFVNRVRLTQGISFVVLAIALGKGLGAFYQLYVTR